MGLKDVFRDMRKIFRILQREREAAQTSPAPPSLTATLEEVERLDPEDPLLAAIAIRHHDPTVAGAAAERVKPRRALRTIANTQEASREARIAAIAKLRFDEEFFVELAIRDDDTVVAQFAAQHVRSREWMRDLLRSKYETVRLVVAMQSEDPELLDLIVHEDACPEIRAQAELRLRALLEGYSKS